MSTDPQPVRGDGLEGSLHRLARSIALLVQTRLEILSTEIAEERVNLTRLALGALLVLFCVQAGLLLGVVFIVLVVLKQQPTAIGYAAIGLLAAAAAVVLLIRRWLKRRPPMFASTIGELRKDRERLGDRS
jgi:uncharacterized membrane protein YqjE